MVYKFWHVVHVTVKASIAGYEYRRRKEVAMCQQSETSLKIKKQNSTQGPLAYNLSWLLITQSRVGNYSHPSMGISCSMLAL